MTYYVWVLFVFSAHPVIVDNIATKEDCVRVQKALLADNHLYSRCFQVGKVTP